MRIIRGKLRYCICFEAFFSKQESAITLHFVFSQLGARTNQLLKCWCKLFHQNLRTNHTELCPGNAKNIMLRAKIISIWSKLSMIDPWTKIVDEKNIENTYLNKYFSWHYPSKITNSWEEARFDEYLLKFNIRFWNK